MSRVSPSPGPLQALLIGLVAVAALVAPAASAAEELTILPGAAELVGQNGARFSSSLVISNIGTDPARVTIGLIPLGGSTPSPASLTIAPGETRRVAEALKMLFALESAAGALRVTSDRTVIASLQTVNVADPVGTYGLALLPVPESDLFRTGETGHSVWASQSASSTSGSRTNVSLTLVDPNTSVTVRVLDETGAVRGTATVSSVTPISWQARLQDLITGALELGRVEFAVTAGRATGYTVVNDNVTSDAIAIQAERVLPGATDKLLSGSAKAPGLFGSFWSTGARLFNSSNAAVDVTIDAIGFGVSKPAVSRSIAARGLVELSPVLDLFGLPDGSAGALRFRASAPVLIAARTANVDPTGVRTGVFSAQQFISDYRFGLLPSGAAGSFIGIGQTSTVPGVRSNLTLFGGPEGASGSLVLRDAAGTETGRVPFTAAPGQWQQRSVSDWFPSAGSARPGSGSGATLAIPTDARVDVEVGGGSLDGYVSRIDNGSGDAITTPLSAGCGVPPFTIDSFSVAPPSPSIGQPAVLSWTYSISNVSSQTILESEKGLISLQNQVRSTTQTFTTPGLHVALLVARKGCRVESRLLFYTVGCANPPVVDTTSLPSGTIGSSYGPVTLAASGGVAPYSWTATGLPAGLTLSSAGVLSGVPTAAGSLPVAFKVTDAAGCSGEKTLTIVICTVLTLTPGSLPDGAVGSPYSRQISASGGTPPVTFARTAGTLPSGLSLSSSGLLSGTPNSAGTFSFTVTATDANGCTGSRVYTLRICPVISVQPPTLPAGTTGILYSATVSGVGGAAPYTFAAAGALPAGLTLNTGTGLISGTPTQGGTFNFTITATDVNGCTGSTAYSIVITCPGLFITPPTLPAATAAQAYSQTLTGNGGTGPYTFAVTAGALPAGLTLSTAGLLSGTPTVTGTFNFSVRATDANNCTVTQAYSLLVNCPTITLAPGSPLPGGVAGVAYSQTITASGGIAPYTFAVTAGALPTGLSVSTAGLLSGTPTVTGTFNFTITATDANGCTGFLAYSLTIACPTIAITPTTLSNGTAGVAYGPVTFAQTGGVGAITWSIFAGAFPAGMTLSAAGVLSGTPTVTGTFNFTVRATDANGCTGDQALTLVVNCPTITVAPPTLPGGTVAVAYNQTITSTGGVGAVTFAVSLGTLPTGLTLTPAGVLSGTPTVGGTFNFTVTATDSNSCTGSRAYSVTITCPAVTLAPPTLPGGVVGTPYSQSIVASGTPGPFTYSVTSGTLPTSLTLSAAGLLSGTPSAAGDFTFTVTAIDTVSGCSGSQSYTVRICPVITITPATFDFRVTVPFSDTLVAAGGTGPYTFAVTAGTLPLGLTLAANGALTGTPTTAGPYSFTVTATDTTTNCTGTITYTGQVCPVITLAALADGQVAVPYSQSAAASPAGTYTYAVTAGTLPGGLPLDVNTGAVTGTPTTQQVANFTITATDVNGCTGVRAYTVTIVCPTITVDQLTLPNGTSGVAYNQTVTASGGTPAYTFAVTLGTLPTGLTLASGGALTGTPTALGTFNFTITATDANGCTGSRAYSITISCGTITVAGAPPGGTAGTAYTTTFTATGGVAPRTFSVTAGSLPTGLTLSSAGVLSGTPTAANTFNFTITATDSTTGSGSPCTGSQAFSITIVCPAITVNPATLPNGVVGTAYAGGPITATGGTAPYTFAVTAGGLPTGVTLNSNGTFSGTPTVAGLFSFTITATDANNCTGSRAYVNVRICPNITLAVAASCATVGTAYSSSVAASPAGTYTYAVTSGALPGGVLLDVNTGALTGTPTTAGSFGFTVTATETSSGCTGSQAQTINVLNMTPAAGALTAGTFGVFYTQTFTASGGSGGFTYAVTVGTIPGGVTLSAGGVLSGTPSGATGTGNFSFTVTATNTATGCTVAKAYTLLIRPNAQPDSFNDVGNTQLAVVASCPSAVATPNVCVVGSVLANDTGPTPLSAGPAVIPTTNGGSVAMNTDGTFVFTPIVGSTAADTFTYTLTDNNVITNTALVTINLSNVVWYVNGANGVNGDGRSNTPFNTMASASTAHLSGQIVFVHSAGSPTATPGNIVMKATTTLWGQGTSLPLVAGIAIQGTGATTKPSLTGTVTLGGSTILVSSLDVNTSAGTALSDNQVGAITGITTQNAVGLSATSNPAVVLSDVTGTLTFASVSSTNSGATGVSLTNVAGSFAASAGAISNATGTDFFVSGGDATVAFDGTINDASGTVANVQNATGGAKTFSGQITSGSISMTGNSASTTVTFRGGIQLSTGASNAFTATGAGTLSVCDENPCNPGSTGGLVNTLTTTTGTALNVNGVTISANNLEFRSISANGATDGIALNTTAALGGLKVKGTGGAGSGGTIQNCSQRGAELISTSNVSLAFMNFTNNATSSGAPCGSAALATSNNTGCNGPIYLQGATTVILDNLNVSGSTQQGLVALDSSNLTLSNSILSGLGNGPDEDGLHVTNLSGTNSITNTSIASSGDDNVNIQNLTGTSSITITGGSFNTGVLGSGILFGIRGTSNTTIAISGVTIDNNFSGGVVADSFDTATMSIDVGTSTIINNNDGIQVSAGQTANAQFDIHDNANISGQDFLAISLLKAAFSTGGLLEGAVRNNVITIANGRPTDAISVFQAGGGGLRAAITGNTINYAGTQRTILVQAGQDGNGSLEATITGNNIDIQLDGVGNALNGILAQSAITGPGNTASLCADLGGAGALRNTFTHSLGGSMAGGDIRVRQRNDGTVRLPGYGGAATDTVAVISYLSGRNIVVSAPTATFASTGFAGGLACLQPTIP